MALELYSRASPKNDSAKRQIGTTSKYFSLLFPLVMMEMSSALSLMLIEFMLARGLGIYDFTDEEFERLLKSYADQGLPASRTLLGILPSFLSHFLVTLINVALRYLNKHPNNPKLVQKGIKLLEEAAAEGNAKAQFNFGSPLSDSFFFHFFFFLIVRIFSRLLSE